MTGEVACHCQFGGRASEMLLKCIFLKIALEVSVEAPQEKSSQTGGAMQRRRRDAAQAARCSRALLENRLIEAPEAADCRCIPRAKNEIVKSQFAGVAAKWCRGHVTPDPPVGCHARKLSCFNRHVHYGHDSGGLGFPAQWLLTAVSNGPGCRKLSIARPRPSTRPLQALCSALS